MANNFAITVLLIVLGLAGMFYMLAEVGIYGKSLILLISAGWIILHIEVQV